MKKKIFSLITCLCLMFVCLLTTTACGDNAPKMDVWNGTAVALSEAKKGVIKIDSAEELASLARSVNSGDDYSNITVKLTCDIDLNNIEWTPIGYGSSTGYGTLDTEDSHYFNGTFDGQNHTIKNLKITNFAGGGFSNKTAATGVGLFGHLFDATIKNLKVRGANVEGNHFVAVVAGFTLGTTIKNVHVANATVNCLFLDSNDSGDKASTVAAYMCNSISSNSSIENCSAKNSTIQADRDAGQIVGCYAKFATASTTYTDANNSATNVEVSWSGLAANEGKSNTHINNDIIGRDERQK